LNIIGSIRKKKMYAISSPRAVIEIKGKIKMTALLDTEADINVMIVEVADAINLPILEITLMEIEIFTGYNTQLVRICLEVNI
jgi:hypothetical protein